jgi:beta-glucosidase
MKESFFWGASTSSHQVEGGNFNNWSVFEREKAKELLDRSLAEFSCITDRRESKNEIRDASSYVSAAGPDHYHLYRKDIQLMKKLGFNAYRFSVEWSRIEPIEGSFDNLQIKHYQDLVDELLKNRIEPIVTLWHFALPVWFEKSGGFAKLDNVKKFGRYCEVISKSLKKVNYFLTINEPNIYASQSFLFGRWPPQTKNLILAYNVYQNLKLAHRLSYKKIKKHRPRASISFAHNICHFEPHNNTLYNKLFCRVYSNFWNDDFIKSVKAELDFIALNFYFYNKIHWGKIKNDNKKISDLGWELKPESLYDVLVDLKKYNLPIMITENGLADSQDKYRSWFIRKSVEAIKKAKGKGVKVIGYLHWALIDNFEWDKGYWPRFGLVGINYKNKKRIIRKSAKIYSKLIKQGCFK